MTLDVARRGSSRAPTDYSGILLSEREASRAKRVRQEQGTKGSPKGQARVPREARTHPCASCDEIPLRRRLFRRTRRRGPLAKASFCQLCPILIAVEQKFH